HWSGRALASAKRCQSSRCIRRIAIAALQPALAADVSSGSWLCENADVLRRRRITFSSARCSFLLARGSPLGTHRCSDAEISKTPRFLHFWRAARDLPFVLLCVEPRVIWRRVGIGF